MYVASIAVYCIAVHCIALYCTVLYGTMFNGTVLHCTVLHGTILHGAVLHVTALYCSALYCISQHYIDRRCTALHDTVLHGIVLRYSVNFIAMGLTGPRTKNLQSHSVLERLIFSSIRLFPISVFFPFPSFFSSGGLKDLFWQILMHSNKIKRFSGKMFFISHNGFC